MDNITIPPEALEKARTAFANAGTADDAVDPIHAACLAMLKAWPGMRHGHNETGTNEDWAQWFGLPWHRAEASGGLILPLTTENIHD